MSKTIPSEATIEKPECDERDADILERLAKGKRCQQRLRTDAGRHYIFCGGYYDLPARKTKAGWRCEFHSNKEGENARDED